MKRTSAEWCRVLRVRVLDPDGWRVEGAPDWDHDEITREEFDERVVRSTVHVLTARDVEAMHSIAETKVRGYPY